MKRLILTLFIALTSIGQSAFSQNAEAYASVENLVGQSVTNFTGKTLRNVDFELSDYKGKSIMLLFWSRHCGGCNKELPDLNKIVQHSKDSSFILLSVIDESEEQLRDSTSRLSILDQENQYYKYKELIFFNDKIDFEIVVDGKEIRKQLGLPSASPITLFIDHDLVIRDVNQVYYMYNNLEILTQKINYLMAENWSTPFEMRKSKPIIVVRPD